MLESPYDRLAWLPLGHGNALLSLRLASHRPCSLPAAVAAVDRCQEWAVHGRKAPSSDAAQEGQ